METVLDCLFILWLFYMWNGSPGRRQ